MRHPMECHITDFDDEPPEHEDEEVRDALTREDFPDDLVRALMDIGGVYRPGFMTKFQAD